MIVPYNHHKPPLSQEVFKAIKPVYDDLNRDELLNRCLGGFTQNSNESFNAAVCNLAPKAYSSGKKVLHIATDIAVCNFNYGLKNGLRIMQVLEMEIGAQSYNFCVESDAMKKNISIQKDVFTVLELQIFLNRHTA